MRSSVLPRIKRECARLLFWEQACLSMKTRMVGALGRGNRSQCAPLELQIPKMLILRCNLISSHVNECVWLGEAASYGKGQYPEIRQRVPSESSKLKRTRTSSPCT